MRTIGYWKLGDRFAYITSRGKRGIVDKLSQVPDSARTKNTGATKKKSQKSSPKKKGGTKTVGKKKNKGKGKGNRILGSYSIKGLLLGSGVLAASKIVIPQAGAYGVGGALAVAGAAAKFLDLPGKALLPVGVMVFASEYILGLLGGNRGGAGSGGGTDY